MPASSSVFSYSTAPQPIRPGKKYRADEGGLSLNLMSDPRVIRGMTNVIPPGLSKLSASKGSTGNGKVNDSSGKAATKSRNKNSEETLGDHKSAYSFESKKYCHEELDLSSYLNEASKAHLTKPVDCQTDIFHVRPPTPEYIPCKTGIDSCTQIDDGNELFNFDDEVEPMLEIIMKKTIEQALFEVNAEEEMKALGECMLRYEQAELRENEWARANEKAAKDLIMLKDKEIEKARMKKNELHQTTLKVAGLQATREIMRGILEDLSAELLANGDWKDPLHVSTSSEVVGVVQGGRSMLESFTAADEIALELLQMAQERYTEMAAYEVKPRRMELSIIFRSEDDARDENRDELGDVDEVVEGGDDWAGVRGLDNADASSSSNPNSTTKDMSNSLSIGPIVVDADDTIASVERKITHALREKHMIDRKFELYAYIVAALKGREFPQDALLLNFDLPPTLNVIV